MTLAWSIRPARPADAGPLKACVEAAYEHYIPRMGQAPGPMLDDYDARIAADRVFVAVEDGKIVGGLVLIVEPDKLLLDNIAVHPDLQGRGLGRALLALADTEARRQGYDEIHLYTHETMTENIALYGRLGWTETERRKVGPYARVYMMKRL